MKPVISVIIPVYNMERYLARCLDSVLGSTVREIEVICIDDGSLDQSTQILRGYQARDDRVVVLTKQNGGVSSARNEGMNHVNGEYVLFVDADDFVHPQFFELLLYAQEITNADFVTSRHRAVTDKDLPIRMDTLPKAPADVRKIDCKELFKRHDLCGYCCGKLMKTETVQNVRFREDISYGEDTLFVSELWESNCSMRSAVLDLALYYYYQREDSLSNASLKKQMDATRIFARKAFESEDKEMFFLDRAIKYSLTRRYLASHIILDRHIARECSGYLRSGLKKVAHSKIYTGKEKLIYSIFIMVPASYWLFRSLKEPYMWRWEKVERRKRRLKKRTGS